jgi:hypothetical protein
VTVRETAHPHVVCGSFAGLAHANQTHVHVTSRIHRVLRRSQRETVSYTIGSSANGNQ